MKKSSSSPLLGCIYCLLLTSSIYFDTDNQSQSNLYIVFNISSVFFTDGITTTLHLRCYCSDAALLALLLLPERILSSPCILFCLRAALLLLTSSHLDRPTRRLDDR